MWSYQCVCVCVCVCVHVCLQTKQDAEPSDEVTQSADNETAGIDNETNADNDTVGANNEDHDGGAEPAEQDQQPPEVVQGEEAPEDGHEDDWHDLQEPPMLNLEVCASKRGGKDGVCIVWGSFEAQVVLFSIPT